MLQFSVPVLAQPQGSMRAFVPKGWKRAVVTSDNPNLKAFRMIVKAGAIFAMSELGSQAFDRHQAVEVDVTFVFPRPKSVNKSVLHKTTKPDCDKTLRAVLDALAGTVYYDDAQVTDCHSRKRFGMPQRCDIVVRATPSTDNSPLWKNQESNAR